MDSSMQEKEYRRMRRNLAAVLSVFAFERLMKCIFVKFIRRYSVQLHFTLIFLADFNSVRRGCTYLHWVARISFPLTISSPKIVLQPPSIRNKLAHHHTPL